jgi:hypothetical protein
MPEFQREELDRRAGRPFTAVRTKGFGTVYVSIVRSPVMRFDDDERRPKQRLGF